MRSVFFITKLASVYHVVLSLMEEKLEDDVLVVAGSDEVEEFFTRYTNYSVQRMHVNPNLVTRNTKKDLIKNIILARREYIKKFSFLKNAEIYFFGNSYSLVIFYYIKKLARHNTVYYGASKQIQATVKYPKAHGITASIMKWTAWLCFGVKTTIHDNQGHFFWRLPPSFFSNHQIKKIQVDKKPELTILPEFDFLQEKKVLVTLQDLLVYNYVTEYSFIQTLNKLMDILEENANAQYLIKPHPRESTLYGKMKESKQIAPSFIPSEFLLHHPWNIVVGFFSTSLITASIMTDATIISLIDLFDWEHDSKKTQWKETLKGYNILFPQTMEEVHQEIKKALL